MLDKKLFKNIDFNIIILVVILFLISLVIISSATQMTMVEGITRQVKVQFITFFLGLIAIAFILIIDYKVYSSFHKYIYVLSILMLLLVYVPGLGKVQFGARSWIDLGLIDFQPSEIVKIGFILSFAKFLENRQDKLDTVKSLIPVALFAAIPVFLLLREPDLGNTLVIVVIVFGMIFVSGLEYKVIGKGFVAGVIALPIFYKFMEPHQRIRIDAFLNPADRSLPGNYQVWNSRVAIGSGQFSGKGLYQGTQNNNNFIPVQESDFIFAVMVEELGFIAGIVILILYFIFLFRMIKIAKNAKDIYGSLVVVGITTMFAFQIFQNIGMTMGVMPVTGVTLPFLSYGGSSLLTNMIAVGIVLNIGMRRHKIKF